VAFDFKCRGKFKAVIPATNPRSRSPVTSDINFYILDPKLLEETPSALTIRAPGRAVQYNVSLGFRRCLGFAYFAGGAKHSSPGRFHFLKDFEKNFVIRLFIFIMDVDVADYTALVDHKDSPFAETLRAQYSVCLGDLSMRIEIAQQRIRYAAKAISPSF
jgi:hypothetical protein